MEGHSTNVLAIRLRQLWREHVRRGATPLFDLFRALRELGREGTGSVSDPNEGCRLEEWARGEGEA